MIRVIIIEDQIIIGVGLRSMFHPSHDGIEIVKLFRSVQDTIIKAKSHLFDMIILDLWIGKSNPEDNVKDLRAQFPEKPILVFTGEESMEWKRKMIQIGVNGYITKSAIKSELKSAIQGISYNGNYFPSTIKELPRKCLNKLNPIELSIAILLSEGYVIREIASKKMLSISTVENILIKLRKKYSSSNNCELVKIFFKRNILN